MQKLILFVFVILFCLGSSGLDTIGIVSEEEPATEQTAKEILTGETEESPEEDDSETEDEDESSKIAGQLYQPSILFTRHTRNKMLVMACIEHSGEMHLPPPEL